MPLWIILKNLFRTLFYVPEIAICVLFSSCSVLWYLQDDKNLVSLLGTYIEITSFLLKHWRSLNNLLRCYTLYMNIKHKETYKDPITYKEYVY